MIAAYELVEIWSLFRGMDYWLVSIILALIGIGLAFPLKVALSITGPIKKYTAGFHYILNPIVEEAILRLVVLAVTISTFGLIPGIILTTILYMIYGSFIYGAPYIADSIVLGVLFSFAFLEFGFIPVLLAHIVYKVVFSAWPGG